MEKFYKIFKTRWGFAGVIFNRNSIIKFILPMEHKNKIISQIEGKNFSGHLDWLISFCQDIKKFFKGEKVDFIKYKLDLSVYTENEKKVLKNLRKIKYGKTITYKELAEKVGIKNGARFIGNVMAKNRFPLIIPCHRVIKSNGEIGNFGYGKKYKENLLALEKESKY